MERRTFVVAFILGVFLVSDGVIAAGAATQAAPPQPPPGPRYIVTYVDVVPASEAQGVTLLKAYRDASRREDGNVRVDILQQNGRRGQFVVVEEWRDESAWKAHRAAPHVMQFHESLTPLRITAYDERTHTSFAVGAPSTVADALFVVTHVDVIPTGLPKAREFLNAHVERTRKEAGNVRFDVLQGARMNHFTVVEAWRDERAREAHITAAHTRTYREGLRETAIDGSPYDERLYRLVQ
jgi:quinol monooxygenase YgiN